MKIKFSSTVNVTTINVFDAFAREIIPETFHSKQKMPGLGSLLTLKTTIVLKSRLWMF